MLRKLLLTTAKWGMAAAWIAVLFLSIRSFWCNIGIETRGYVVYVTNGIGGIERWELAGPASGPVDLIWEERELAPVTSAIFSGFAWHSDTYFVGVQVPMVYWLAFGAAVTAGFWWISKRKRIRAGPAFEVEKKDASLS